MSERYGRPGPNTRVNYLYRDGSNYKQWGVVVYAGHVTPEQKSQLDDLIETSFIPQQVEMDSLLTQWESHYEDDHPWHELWEVETTREPTSHDETATEWAARFLAVEQWDEKFAEEDFSEFISSTPRGR